LAEIETQLNGAFVERQEAVRAILLALITGQNFILVGPPGTAKTQIMKAAFSHVTGARTFSVLCGAFATEDKIFGPVDLGELKENRWKRATTGRLADCELAILDEVLKANTGTINSMLTAMNEREYDGQPIPLRCCGAATNWPEVRAKTEHAAAFWDRLMIRVPIKKLEAGPDPQVANQPQVAKKKAPNKDRLRMLQQAATAPRYAPRHTVSLTELDAVVEESSQLPIPDLIFSELLHITDQMLQVQLDVSDRRLVNMLAVLRANAWLAGRDKVKVDDFEVIKFCAWDATEAQYTAVDKIAQRVDQDNVKHVVDLLNAAIRQCKNATDPSQAPNFAKQATEAAFRINEFIKANAIREANWLKTIKPLIDEFKREKNRMEGLIKAASPKPQVATR
jgi:MoxR-like ATPase